MVLQHSLDEGTITPRRRERARVRRDRYDAVRIDSLDPHRHLPCGRVQHPRQKKCRIPVRDDQAGIPAKGGDEAPTCAWCVFDIGVIEERPVGESSGIRSHAVEDEAMQAIAGPPVVAPECLQHDQRPLQFGGDFDRTLEAEVGPRPARHRHPVEHVGSGRPDGSAVEGTDSRIRCHRAFGSRYPSDGSVMETLSKLAVAAAVVVWLETPRPM